MRAIPLEKALVYARSALEEMFLPTDQMLQIDRVTEIRDDRIFCEMDIENHWVFPMHFPSDPIFPGTFLIEAAGQSVAIWAWHFGLRGRPRLVKVAANFESAVLPSDPLVVLAATVRRRRNVCFGNVEIFAGDRKAAGVELALIVSR